MASFRVVAREAGALSGGFDHLISSGHLGTFTPDLQEKDKPSAERLSFFLFGGRQRSLPVLLSFIVASPTPHIPRPMTSRSFVWEGEWTGARELTVRLGYEAYVVPGPTYNASCTSPSSCITLKDGGVRTEAFALLSSSGSTSVLAPSNPPLVSAVLVAPQVRYGSARSARDTVVGVGSHPRLVASIERGDTELTVMPDLAWPDLDFLVLLLLPQTPRAHACVRGTSICFGTFQAVGRCGSFRLDARASSGGAARSLSAFWSVSTAEGSSAAALAAANASLAPFQGSLLAELNATALEVGVEFTFSLAAQSFLGNADEAVATVTRR